MTQYLAKPIDHLVPIEQQSTGHRLDGSNGTYRNPNPGLALIRANHDLDAIHTWLDTVAQRSDATRRAYRKEAERLLAWALVEQQKAVSSLDLEDFLDYERFLGNPVSRHPGVIWIAEPYRHENGETSVRRLNRKHKNWRPFDGPLAPGSIEYALQVLKSLFSYWTDVGYTVVNPLKARRKKRLDKPSVIDRVLSPATWQFLYGYLAHLEGSIPSESSPKTRLRLLRQANQRYMIFTALYLLGVRLSELASIRMCDFTRRHTAAGEDHYWLKILGKGNKTRTIPVPTELLDVVARYRRMLNTFPVDKRRVHDAATPPLQPLPSTRDETYLILSASGTGGLTPDAIYKIVKATLADALRHYEQLADAGVAPGQVNSEQLMNASTHWLRHTSATHQSLKGVSLRYIKDYLGHANYDTTIIYSHLDNDHWVNEIRMFHT